MSAPTDTTHATTTTGAAPATDSSHLEQPNDAVPMESMANDMETETNKPLTSPAADATTSKAAPNEPATEAGPSTTANTDGDATTGSPVNQTERPGRERHDSVLAIGPAQDEIKAVTPGADDLGPVCNITLLLTSGSRHPYKISAKYLSRRNVPIPEQTDAGLPDPFSISVYTLKELILREWRAEWEDKPASPGGIRLIHFGKLLDDKEPLRKYQFVPESPNVVHMSIRPADLEEDEPKTGGKSPSQAGGDGVRERSGGCCVIL